MSSIEDFKKFSENLIKTDFHTIPTFEPTYPKLPKYEEDCDFVDTCQYITKDCFAGAPALISTRCSKERINQMLENKELQPSQNIHIEGSSNVQVNQQGSDSSNHQEQGISIDDIPQELIDEFKELLTAPTKDNKSKWLSFLSKFNAIGGTIVTLTKLISLFAS